MIVLAEIAWLMLPLAVSLYVTIMFVKFMNFVARTKPEYIGKGLRKKIMDMKLSQPKGNDTEIRDC